MKNDSKALLPSKVNFSGHEHWIDRLKVSLTQLSSCGLCSDWLACLNVDIGYGSKRCLVESVPVPAETSLYGEKCSPRLNWSNEEELAQIELLSVEL